MPTLFEFAILFEDKDGTTTLVNFDRVVAESEEKARVVAARAIPDDLNLDSVTILVRPFC